MRGRKPKPSNIKRLQGNPGKRPLNQNEPKPEPKLPSCPKHVTGTARYEWRRVCEELFGLGILTGIDRAALAMYCIAYGTVADAQRELDKRGMLYKTPKGQVMQSPYVGIRNRAMDLARKFMTEFGMTPSSRGRMNIGKDMSDETDEMKQWLEKAEQRKASNE